MEIQDTFSVIIIYSKRWDLPKEKDRKVVFIFFLSDSINWYNCVHCVVLGFYVRQYIVKCNTRYMCVHVWKGRLKEAWKKAYLKEARFDGAIWCQDRLLSP